VPLYKQYIREFLLLLVIVVVGLAVVSNMYDSMGKIGDFKRFDPAISQMLMYWVYTLPRHILYLLPMGTLVSGMFTIGHASRNRELVAYMAAGGRLKLLLVPFVVMGALISLFAFFMSEVVVPASSEKVVEIEESIKSGNKLTVRRVKGVTWLRAEDGSIVKIDLYVPGKDFYKGFTVFSTDDNRITSIINADRARYNEDEDAWYLQNVSDYRPASGEMKFKRQMIWSALGSPAVFSGKPKKPYEMTLFELRDYIRRLKETGFVNMRLNVEMHSKLSYPFINLIVLVLGVSFAAKRNIGGLFAATFSLIFTLAYWFGYTILLSMGYAGIVPPLLAVWAMPVAFGALSAWLFIQIPE